MEQKANGAVISIQNDADINDFPLSNVNGLIEAVNKLEDAITKALNDTPASILFDRRLANGFGDGDKDKETEIQIVNTFRQNKIKPLYDLTDYYVMLCSWTDDFINEIKDKYTDLKNYSNIQLFQKWKEDFVFEFGNLYPEPESITIENNSKKLDNLLKLQQLGANKSDIEAELNEDRIFKNDIDLDGEPQQFEDEDDKIDYNLYKSIYGNNKKLNRYIDSIIKNDDNANNTNKIDEEELTGGKWVTLPNGVHCYIKDGKIVEGADYEKWYSRNNEKRLSGGEYERESALNPNYVRMKKDITKLGEDIKYFKERLKENPNSKSFNERLNKAEADLKEYEDIINKHENSDIGRDDAVLYQAYMKAEAELKEAEDIKRKKEEEEKLKKEQKKEEAKNKKKEKDENNKVSGKEGQQNKNKKITKNYSISYDNETINKCIKSLPKHLQETGNKLYNNNPIPSDLIIKDDANYDTEDILAYIDDDAVDEKKYSQLNEIETLLNRFTENAQGTRESNTFKRLKKDIEELIENAPPVKNPHRVEYMIEGRDDLSIGTVINFDIRSFADFGAGDKTANKIYNYLRDEVDPSKLVVYVIDDEVNGLDMTTISSYPNQNECLINGDFIISEVEEGDEYNPTTVHLKKPKK